MSRLIGGLVATLVLATSPAYAEERRWDLDSRVGYGASWTTGLSYLGVGSGLAGGMTLGVPLHFEIGAFYHSGSIASAATRSLSYWAREWSVLAHVAAGYELTAFEKHLVVRPEAVGGFTFVSDTLRLGNARRSGVDSLLAVGPGLALLAREGGLHAGVDGRALFVPSRVAAPMAAIYVVFGVER